MLGGACSKGPRFPVAGFGVTVEDMFGLCYIHYGFSGVFATSLELWCLYLSAVLSGCLYN